MVYCWWLRSSCWSFVGDRGERFCVICDGGGWEFWIDVESSGGVGGFDVLENDGFVVFDVESDFDEFFVGCCWSGVKRWCCNVGFRGRFGVYCWIFWFFNNVGVLLV